MKDLDRRSGLRQRVWDGLVHRLWCWCRSAQVPAVGAGLLLAEAALVDQLGTPAVLLRALRHLGDSWADPVASVLALLALAGEVLVAYLLVALVLGSLALVPGTIGRLATRLTYLVTPVTVRRALDVLVGGALLAQATLAVLPSALPAARGSPAGFVQTALIGSSDPPWNATELVKARPTPRRASAALPPWLGGGPSKAEPSTGGSPTGEPSTGGRPAGGSAASRPSREAPPDPAPGDGRSTSDAKIVDLHDTLWDIAAAHLAPADRNPANIHRYWQQIYQANRRVVGADPDLILPGMRLNLPPYRPDHR